MSARMSNVIRPTFGSRTKGEPSPESPSDDEYRPLKVFGQAAGYLVALLEDPDAAEGPVFRIVVGPATSNEVETVAILPSTPEGAADADMAVMAILRTLELIEEAAPPSPA